MIARCTVHIVEDEAAVRASVAFLLMNSGYAVCAHESGAAFLRTIGDGRNACLVTDLRMPDMDGIELLQNMRRTGIEMPAIVITGHGDVTMAVAAMKAGAIDFIEKPFDEHALITAIEQATSQAANWSGTSLAEAAARARLAHLTSREREVLIRVLDGLANKTIAHDLNISPRTVEVHRAGVMSKLNAKNLPELLREIMPLKDRIPWLSRSGPPKR